MKLEGSTVAVTGGASGLGEATARSLVAAGSRVAVWDISEDGGRRLADELGASGAFFQTDVTNEDSVRAAVDGTVARFGSIRVLVNCAGVNIPAKALGREGPLPLPVFQKVIQVNLIGTFNAIRLAAQKMALNTPNEEGERGVIVNTASVAAFEGQVGQCAYAASKGGVVSLTLPLAREFADAGIRVVTIAPGLFDTPMMDGLSETVREALGKMTPFPKGWVCRGNMPPW